MALLYWALISKLQDDIAGGFTITTISDVACHMWLRHTLVPPQKHPKPVFRRGLLIMYDARFCFVAFEDLEQNEPGDTYVHTFTWTGWENCQTRYFYFWATNSGEPMHSTSPIFSKHYLYVPPPYGPPVTVRFYPTPGSDGVAADGRADRTFNNSSWASIRGGAGTGAYPSAITGYIGFTCGGTLDTWYVLYRTLLHFDTLLLPADCLIDAATIGLSGYWKSNTIPSLPSLALVESIDPTPGDITPPDYQNLNSAILAPVIPYAEFSDVGWNVLSLPETTFDLIIKAGITKFGLREGNYDCPNIEPPYNRYQTSTFRVSMRDDVEAHWPYLEVTYRPPL